MENIAILLDQPEEFDKVISNSLPDGGNLRVIVKDNATLEGNPAVMFTFTVQLTDGSFQTVQTVTTVKLLLTTLNVLQARYGSLL